jgi:hypothetical protein
MLTREQRAQNEAAYKQMKATLAQTYPHGRFVALQSGQVVADAASFRELQAALTALGKDSRDMFIIQAGVNYPEFAYILLGDRSA